MKNRLSFFLLISILSIQLVRINQNAQAQVSIEDSLALVALYDSTDGANWTNNNNWLTDNDVRYWYGVDVEDGRVKELFLFNNNLNGTLPSEIGDLTELESLNFNSNQLSGKIPNEIGNLVNLTYMQMAYNQFSGPFPTAICNLTQLTSLALNGSPFEDTIPESIGNLTNLEVLYLNTNQLYGDIPDTIWSLTNLSQLHLGMPL